MAFKEFAEYAKRIPDRMRRAACHGAEDVLFPYPLRSGKLSRVELAALRIWAGCEVRTECLA